MTRSGQLMYIRENRRNSIHVLTGSCHLAEVKSFIIMKRKIYEENFLFNVGKPAYHTIDASVKR